MSTSERDGGFVGVTVRDEDRGGAVTGCDSGVAVGCVCPIDELASAGDGRLDGAADVGSDR